MKKKYEVEAGKEFVVVVVEGDSDNINWSTVAGMALAFVVLAFVTTAAYGAVTGDYSPLRSVADYVEDLLKIIVTHASK